MPITILRSEQLHAAGFLHGFSTRLVGDFALANPRAKEHRARLASAVGFDDKRLHEVTQVHGKELVVARGEPTEALEADAVGAEGGSGLAVGVRVADCVPVLLANRSSGRVVAAHAGWRGVEAGVLDSALDFLAGETDVHAVVGPCIGPCCFEVGADVAERIAAAAKSREVIARVTPAQKAYVDLRRAVRAQLERRGVADDRIDDVGGCTYCDAAAFHSFRRDADKSGRLIGVIVAP